MVRYFMTIREACDLVITAATHALAPERPDVSVYVLNMGQPVKIVDLAERMIRLSGLQPGHDIEIVFTGMRPGERLNEILFASEEPTIEIGIAGIMAAKPNEPPMQTLRKWLAALEEAIAKEDRATIRGDAEGCGPRVRVQRRLVPHLCRKGRCQQAVISARSIVTPSWRIWLQLPTARHDDQAFHSALCDRCR